MRLMAVACLALLWSGSARAETLYDFATGCRAAPLAACFARIEDQLQTVRSKHQGAAFCLPRAWGALGLSSNVYPVSLLDYILLRLSAARVSRAAGDPVEVVLRETLADLYPCREAKAR